MIAETLVNLILAIGIAFLPLIITAVRLNRRRIAAKQAAREAAGGGAGGSGAPGSFQRRGAGDGRAGFRADAPAGSRADTRAGSQPSAMSRRLRDGLRELGIFILGDDPAADQASAGSGRGPGATGTPAATAGRDQRPAQRSTPLAGLSPDMVYRRGSSRRRVVPGQTISKTPSPEASQRTSSSSLDRIDRYSRLKQAVVWSEVLGPPRGLS